MNKVKLLISIALYIICFSGLAVQVSNLYQRYMERNTEVSQTELSKTGLQFPQVTLCVDYFTDKNKLCEKFNNNCTKRAMRLMYLVHLQNIDADLRNETSFDPEKLFTCTIKGDGSCKQQFNCVNAMKLTSFRKPLQMCYTLDVATSFNCTEPWLLELRISSAIELQETIIFMKSELVPLIVLESQTSPMTEMANVELKPGYVHDFTMRQQIIRRLPKPFKSDCVDYKAMGYQVDMNGYHSTESCLQQCLIEAEYELCGCVTYTHEFIGNVKYPICFDKERGLEYCRQVLHEMPQRELCIEKCRIPCREIRYDVKLVSIAPMVGVESSDLETHFDMRLRFATDRVEYLEYVAMINFQTVMAYIGGSFGIWIGISSIDILTMILNSIRWLLRKATNKDE